MWRRTTGYAWFLRDAWRFHRLRKAGDGWGRARLRPQLMDRAQAAGTMRGAYFHQDLLVAQRIFAANPRRHIDVGSRIDGFVAHVASFRQIEIVDIRPVASTVENIAVMQADLMQPDSVPESACDSLSCLHALEHFGLGRYGDPIDPQGHRRGLDGLIRMLEPGGTLYLSVPVGPQEILFNCHRRFHASTVLDIVTDRLALMRLDLVDDQGNLVRNLAHSRARTDPALGCRREGCAIFEFRKPPRP